jgi:hypothetical protein
MNSSGADSEYGFVSTLAEVKPSVIAWHHVTEIVDDGVTGCIVANDDEAVATIDRPSEIDRQAVRRVFEKRFTARTMAHNRLELYRALSRYDSKLRGPT